MDTTQKQTNPNLFFSQPMLAHKKPNQMIIIKTFRPILSKGFFENYSKDFRTIFSRNRQIEWVFTKKINFCDVTSGRK